MPESEFVVRHATDEDDYRIEDLRVAAWRATYTTHLSEDYFDGWDYDAIIDTRRSSRQPGGVRLVANHSGGALAGYVIAGKSRDEDLADFGEIYSFYVAPRFWGTGVAHQLMSTTLAQLATYPQVMLWVVADNPRAQNFYGKFGFVADGSAQDAQFPKRVTMPEIRFRQAVLDR